MCTGLSPLPDNKFYRGSPEVRIGEAPQPSQLMPLSAIIIVIVFTIVDPPLSRAVCTADPRAEIRFVANYSSPFKNETLIILIRKENERDKTGPQFSVRFSHCCGF